MWSYEDQKEYFASMAQTDNSAHLTLGYKNINMGNKKLEIEIGMPPMQEERTFTTVLSTNSYPLPERFINMDQLYTTVSSQRHYATPVYNEEHWRRFMYRPNAVTSDILTHVFTRPGLQKFEIFPTAATAGNTMTMIYNAFSKDLSADDYGTGTVAITNGGTTITGTGTTFTAAMAGRWIKPTTDGNWYKISSFTSTTVMTLLMPYQGTTVTTDAFVIGELPRTPEGTHEIAVHYALWMHFIGVKRDVEMAKRYEKLWREGTVWAQANFGSRYSSGVIPSQRRMRQALKDPNNYPDLSDA